MSVVRNSHLNCAYSPAGLAQTVERLPAERKVKGSILGAGPREGGGGVLDSPNNFDRHV